MDCSTLGFPIHHQLPELAQTHVHRVGDAIQPSHPLSSPSPPTFSLSQHQGLSNKSVLCISWPKYWSFSFSISPSNEYLGLTGTHHSDLYMYICIGMCCICICSCIYMGFQGGASGKEPACQCRRHETCGFDPWVRKILWRRAWQNPLQYSYLENPHWQRSLEGYSPWGCKESDMTEVT